MQKWEALNVLISANGPLESPLYLLQEVFLIELGFAKGKFVQLKTCACWIAYYETKKIVILVM